VAGSNRDELTRLPSYVDRQSQVVDVLNVQIATADAEVKAWVEADGTCGRLMTMPGVGPLTVLRFVAAIDDVTRFENAHQVGSYLGLPRPSDCNGLLPGLPPPPSVASDCVGSFRQTCLS
jgi:hypothetical protein